jgi:hypothetical protein
MIMSYSDAEKTIHMKRRICEFIVDDESLNNLGNEFVFDCGALQLNQKIRQFFLEYILYHIKEVHLLQSNYMIISGKKI